MFLGSCHWLARQAPAALAARVTAPFSGFFLGAICAALIVLGCAGGSFALTQTAAEITAPGVNHYSLHRLPRPPLSLSLAV